MMMRCVSPMFKVSLISNLQDLKICRHSNSVYCVSHLLPAGIYLTVIMAMSALSVALSVFVLNCHHRGTSLHRPPKVVKKLSAVIARCFCVRLTYLNNNNYNANNNSRYHCAGNTSGTQPSSNWHCYSMPPYSLNTHTKRSSAPSSTQTTSIPQSMPQTAVGPRCNGSVETNSTPQNNSGLRHNRESKRTMMEAQILHYLKAVLEAYDKGHGERIAILEWQEVARVLDKLFFWLFVVITSLTTVFLLLLSPIAKDVQFPQE